MQYKSRWPTVVKFTTGRLAPVMTPRDGAPSVDFLPSVFRSQPQFPPSHHPRPQPNFQALQMPIPPPQPSQP
jgi:hypothetical protein